MVVALSLSFSLSPCHPSPISITVIYCRQGKARYHHSLIYSFFVGSGRNCRMVPVSREELWELAKKRSVERREMEGKMNSLKSAAIVFSGLAFAWMAVELMFKPFLSKGRNAIDKSDPNYDPDDDDNDNDEKADSEDQGMEDDHKGDKSPPLKDS